MTDIVAKLGVAPKSALETAPHKQLPLISFIRPQLKT